VNALQDPQVVVRGDVSPEMVAYAREKLVAVAEHAPGPVLEAEVHLDHHADPARDRPHHVEVALSLNGRVVRAHRSAATMSEAIDNATKRLERVIETDRELARSKSFRHRDTTSWHHEDRPTERPSFFPRPADEREIVRRKSFAIGPETIEESILELEALDHDFFLFVNDETGEDNVVYRDDGRYGLMQPTATSVALSDLGIDISRGPRPASMATGEACELLNLTGAPFVFYLDADSGRGRVVYVRFDGHYGMITPA
jgi:ribosomal subunit interface protein